MHVIGYLLSAIIPTLCCYFIMRWKQRQEIDAAYSLGFDNCRKSVITATSDEAWNEEDEKAYGDYYRDAPRREPVAVSVVGNDAYSPTWSRPTWEDAPSYRRPAWEDTGPDADAQAEVDQFCRDMDQETELYLAHLGADMVRTVSDAGRPFVRATDVTGPIPAAIIARETHITHREVVIQGTVAHDD